MYTPLRVPITENGSCNKREINTDSMRVHKHVHSIEGANHRERELQQERNKLIACQFTNMYTPLRVPITANGSCNKREINTDSM